MKRLVVSVVTALAILAASAAFAAPQHAADILCRVNTCLEGPGEVVVS